MLHLSSAKALNLVKSKILMLDNENFNPLLYNRFLGWSKMKALAEYKINVIEKLIFFKTL